jgi:hypothetical protein
MARGFIGSKVTLRVLPRGSSASDVVPPRTPSPNTRTTFPLRDPPAASMRGDSVKREAPAAQADLVVYRHKHAGAHCSADAAPRCPPSQLFREGFERSLSSSNRLSILFWKRLDTPLG